jgi:hypothetical protein
VQGGEDFFVSEISGCAEKNESIRLKIQCGLIFQLDRKL